MIRTPRTIRTTRATTLALTLLLAASLAAFMVAGTAQAVPATFVVNSTGNAPDANPGDGLCQTATAGECTLRAAIQQANANANPTETDTINFLIPPTDPGCNPTTGVCTISPDSQLPDNNQPVTVDGYSQPGASPNSLATGNNAALKIELSGADAESNDTGISIDGPGSVVKGLIVNRWGTGINVGLATGSHIEGNFVGTDASGNGDLGNRFDGVNVLAGDSVVGGTNPAARNVISGNDSMGVDVDTTGSNGNRIEGNLIGTDKTGNADLGNSFDGVRITGVLSENVVGGTTPATRNVISGNNRYGVNLQDGARNNRIEGNFIGTKANGTEALGNSEHGVQIVGSPENVVGGTVAGARNVISRNGGNGVSVEGGADGSVASSNRIAGNFIGTDASGTQALGNSARGVRIDGNARENVVGGTSAGARNVISGNGDGVGVFNGLATENRIEGNFIGTDASGNGDLGNSDDGVDIAFAPGNVVGGASAGARNVISGNGRRGVSVDGTVATSNRILRNSISDNDELGIDLTGGTENSFGVTANDPGDADTGDNNLQNYPVITSATTSGGTTTIQGTLNSTPNDTFNIQFFSSPQADPSGFGEGETYEGQTNVTTNASGNTTFTFTTTTPIAGGRVVTSTATNTVTSDTSEFSEAVEVEADTPPPPPQPQCSDGVDNDADGQTDFPDDTDCSSATDNSESPEAPPGCTIIGTNGDDTLSGTSGDDTICGLGGNDTINADSGDDTVRGGEGNDTVSGDSGNDTLHGEGDDTVRGGAGSDDLSGGSGSDRLHGEAGNDDLDARDGVKRNDLADGGTGKDTCRSDKKDRKMSCP